MSRCTSAACEAGVRAAAFDASAVEPERLNPAARVLRRLEQVRVATNVGRLAAPAQVALCRCGGDAGAAMAVIRPVAVLRVLARCVWRVVAGRGGGRLAADPPTVVDA